MFCLIRNYVSSTRCFRYDSKTERNVLIFDVVCLRYRERELHNVYQILLIWRVSETMRQLYLGCNRFLENKIMNYSSKERLYGIIWNIWSILTQSLTTCSHSRRWTCTDAHLLEISMDNNYYGITYAVI